MWFSQWFSLVVFVRSHFLHLIAVTLSHEFEFLAKEPGQVVQSVVHLTHIKPEVPGSIPSLATYFCFSFC